MQRPLIIFYFLMGTCTLLSAQDEYRLCLNINPADATVKIDDQVIHLGEKQLPYCVKLESGDYTIEIWHPNFELFKDTIQIGRRKTIVYEKSLKEVRATYADHLELAYAYRTRKTKRAVNLGLLGIAEIGLIAITFSNPPDLKRLKKDADAAKRNYYSKLAAEDIALAEKVYNNKRDEYKKERKQEVFKKSVGIPLIAGTTFLALRYIRKIKRDKLVKPIFNGPDNPYTLQLTVDPVFVSAGFQMTYSF